MGGCEYNGGKLTLPLFAPKNGRAGKLTHPEDAPMSKTKKNSPPEKNRANQIKRNPLSKNKKNSETGIQSKSTAIFSKAQTTKLNVNKASFFSLRTLRSVPTTVYPYLPLVGLLVLTAAVLVLIWDTASEQYALRYVTSWFTRPVEDRYEPLPINDIQPVEAAPAGMAWIPGGFFWMGAEDEGHGMASPIHKVYVDAFWMDQTEVTNAMWAEFARETGYKTVAERKPHPLLFPDFDPNILATMGPFSAVVTPPLKVRNLDEHMQWWKGVEGADWKHPQGPKSNIDGKDNYPVVQISWIDAVFFCNWRSHKAKLQPCYDLGLKESDGSIKLLTVLEVAKLHEDKQAEVKVFVPEDFVKRPGFRLPTEAEWEFAARGKLNQKKFLWGDELKPEGKHLANIWQGEFPNKNSVEDGFELAAPVKTYPPNPYGLYDMAGNVWEWCQDWYQPEYYRSSPEKNPPGPLTGFDPNEPGEPKRVQRGGSFLCHESYCERYLTYARGKGEVTSAANHIGFRTVRAPKMEKAP
jgi:sulfatase modifying factor 1